MIYACESSEEVASLLIDEFGERCNFDLKFDCNKAIRDKIRRIRLKNRIGSKPISFDSKECFCGEMIDADSKVALLECSDVFHHSCFEAPPETCPFCGNRNGVIHEGTMSDVGRIWQNFVGENLVS